MDDNKKFKEIAQSRLRAGKLLIDSGDYTLAIDIMGFGLECALKSCICKLLILKKYPDLSKDRKVQGVFKTHNFDLLLILSGLSSEIKISGDEDLYYNWSETTKIWSPDTRYEPINNGDEGKAKKMYNSLNTGDKAIFNWLAKEGKW